MSQLRTRQLMQRERYAMRAAGLRAPARLQWRGMRRRRRGISWTGLVWLAALVLASLVVIGALR